MVTPVEISACTAGEHAELLHRLDEEFIFSRGRRVGIEARFPEAMRSEQSVLLCARTGHGIIGGLLLRFFEWTGADSLRAHRGAMIGLVWTDAEHRAQGIATSLMKSAAREARQKGCEFAVLWTAQPAFYARLGWIGADCGMLGALETGGEWAKTAAPLESYDCGDITRLESLRMMQPGRRVGASALRFETLLPPATQSEVLLENGSYAVTGNLGDTGYVYEIGGTQDGMPRIWSILRARYRRLYLNVPKGAAAHRMLAADPAIHWREQQLAMWLPLADDARGYPYDEWYVPFLDRI